MNDLVRPTASISSVRVPAIGPSGVLGFVPNPPPQLAQMSVGSTLPGVVVGHDAEGHTLVRTDLGTLSVATKAQLPVNSEVTLHIRSSGGQLHVLIVHSEPPNVGAKGAAAPQPSPSTGTLAGGTLAGGAEAGGTQAGAAQVGGTGLQGQIPAPAAHGPAADLLTLGQHLRAVVQSPAATPGAAVAPGAEVGGAQPTAGSALAALAAQLVPGSELNLRIISVQAPTGGLGGTPAAGSLSPPPEGPASGGPASGGPASGGPASGGPASGGLANGAPVPGATAPAVPGGAPGRISGTRGGNIPHGALPGGSGTGQAVPSTLPGAAANGPIPATAAPPAAATPASGVPASGAIASYAAAGGSSGAAALVSGLSTAANPAALLAAHGIGPDGGSVAKAPSFQPSAAPGTNIAAPPGGAPAAAAASATPAIPPAPGAAPVAAPGWVSGALQFTGTMTAVTHAGQPILQTPLGTMTLEIRAALQVGSRIVFELPSGAFGTSGPSAAGSGPAPLGTLAHSWPALEETLRVLQEVAPPGVAAATLRDAIPQPGSRLASGLLFFLSALSAGNVNRWIGNSAIQALKSAGRDSLVSRLRRDFGQLGRLADNEGGDWRLFFIPIHDGDQLQQLRLFLRNGGQDGDGGAGQDDEDPTRFVVEVEMSRLGELQLDGLVRKKRLDLILRSRAPLPEFMRRDITQIFHEANEITGNRGSIGFQSSIEWKAMPIEAPEAAGDAGVVV